MSEKIRKEFEEWATSTKCNSWFRLPDTKEGYVDGVTNVAFLAFQAAHKASRHDELVQFVEWLNNLKSIERIDVDIKNMPITISGIKEKTLEAIYKTIKIKAQELLKSMEK